MVSKTISQATEELVAAIHASDEYAAYSSLKESIAGDETTRALLKEYQRLQMALQMAAASGREAESDTVERFTRLSGLLYMNQDASQFLLAQLRMQKLAGDMFQRITEAAGLEMDLPGM